MRLLPVGERGVLVEVDDTRARRALLEALDAAPAPGVVETVPGLRTVLLRLDAGADVARLRAHLAALPTGGEVVAQDGPVIEIPVRYDGQDLTEVAGLLGVEPAEVVRRHTGQVWTCEIVGFLPGFAYLTGEAGDLEVPRRDSPRTRIPAGSVALAGPWSAVYPGASPGGWQLIGTTDAVMFDTGRSQPALVTAGTRVRFVEA